MLWGWFSQLSSTTSCLAAKIPFPSSQMWPVGSSVRLASHLIRASSKHIGRHAKSRVTDGSCGLRGCGLYVLGFLIVGLQVVWAVFLSVSSDSILVCLFSQPAGPASLATTTDTTPHDDDTVKRGAGGDVEDGTPIQLLSRRSAPPSPAPVRSSRADSEDGVGSLTRWLLMDKTGPPLGSSCAG